MYCLPQCLHTHVGLSGLWVLRWAVKWSRRWKDFSQKKHLWLRGALCTTMCRSRRNRDTNTLPQPRISHLYNNFFSWPHIRLLPLFLMLSLSLLSRLFNDVVVTDVLEEVAAVVLTREIKLSFVMEPTSSVSLVARGTAPKGILGELGLFVPSSEAIMSEHPGWLSVQSTVTFLLFLEFPPWKPLPKERFSFNLVRELLDPKKRKSSKH